MSLLAWWTAFQSKGVTQKELQEYVDRWSQSKEAIVATQQANQDRDIGTLMGKGERIIDRMNVSEGKINELEHGQIEFKTKLDLVANYLEEERKAKK
jgi:DNA-binding transcriptional MerR regulator